MKKWATGAGKTISKDFLFLRSSAPDTLKKPIEEIKQ
jgi:hypothetical protein